jgi:O-antigen ligase
MFMTDISKDALEKSFVAKVVVVIKNSLGGISSFITNSFTYKAFNKSRSITTITDIISSSKILNLFRVSADGYSVSFFLFLLLLFFSGLFPTMVVVFLALFVMVFALFEKDFHVTLKKTKPIFTDVLIAFYMLNLILGLYLSKDPSKFNVFLVYIVFVGLYFTIRYFISSKRKMVLSVSYFTLSGIFICLFGVYQYLTGSYQTTTWTDTQLFSDIEGRIYSTFQNPNVFGEYLLFLIPVSLAMVIISKQMIHKIIYGGALALSLICLILTYSRGCWLGLLGGLAIFVLLLYKKFLVPFVALSPFAILMIPKNILNRFQSIGNLKDGSTAFRVYVWRGTVAMLENIWPIGAGIGTKSFESAYAPYAYADIMAPHSHSLYFHLLSETGIFGILVFIALCYFIIRQLLMVFKHSKDRSLQILAVAFVAGFISFLIQGFFFITFYNYRMYMLFFAIVSLSASLYSVAEEKV